MKSLVNHFRRRSDVEFVERLRWFHRHRRKWAALAMAIGLLILAGAAWAWFTVVERHRVTLCGEPGEDLAFHVGLTTGYVFTKLVLLGLFMIFGGFVFAFGGRKDQLLLNCWAETADEVDGDT